MTRQDIEHLAQVLVSLRGLGSRIADVAETGLEAVEKACEAAFEDEYNRLIDRMLWAIHSSKDNPHFDERRFRDFVLGKVDGDSHQMFVKP